MPYRIDGMRLGVMLSTPSGMVRNGDIKSEQRAHFQAAGYRLQVCSGVPDQPAQPAQPDSATRGLSSAVDRHMREVLKPLRKRTYQEQFQ